MARLVIREGRLVRPIGLGDEAVVIGAAAGCDVQLTAEGVHPKHARIERTPRGWRVKSVAPGGERLLINDREMATRRLRHGDQLALGKAVVVFEDPKGPAAREPPPSRVVGAGTPGSEEIVRLRTTLRALASETDVRTLLTLIVDEVISLTSAERGFLILRNAAEKYEMVAARTHDGENVRRPGLKISRVVAEQVARTGKPLLTTNAQADARLSESSSVEGMKLRSVLCLPLRARGRFLGFLYLDHRFEEGAFLPEDLEILEAFADQAAVALQNLRLVADLRAKTDELAKSKARVEELNRMLEERVDRQRRELDEVRILLREKGAEPLKYEYTEIVGRSAEMREVLQLVDHVTETSASVLILGESGTGKELIARAIHRNGPRSREAFVAENCAAIPESLIESVLFGHVRGAFTGADRDKVGLFELASGGTLFLDEMGDLPPSVQVRLLRVLETGELRPVGGKRTLKVDVRILAATHRDLPGMVEAGTFREDLFYRINVLQVRLPPLRRRPADIADLVDHFLALHAAEMGGAPKTITDEALALLCGYAWPGNVRQLRNEIQRAVALSENVILPEVLSPEIKSQSVPLPSVGSASGRGLKDMVQEAVDLVERRLVEEALNRTGWHKTDTAALLQVSRPTLDAKIKRHGLQRDSRERPGA